MDFVYLSESSCEFPPPHTARLDGILAVGGNLNCNTLLDAYKLGTFPWFNEGDPILWYHPNPRFVLFPEKLNISHSMRSVLNKNNFRLPAIRNLHKQLETVVLNISHSMRSVLNKNNFRFTCNKKFAQTIRNCRIAKRKGTTGENTWITDDIEKAYISLFEQGCAHSAETWYNGELVGGLYGVRLGKVFFGESM